MMNYKTSKIIMLILLLKLEILSIWKFRITLAKKLIVSRGIKQITVIIENRTIIADSEIQIVVKTFVYR